MVSYVFGALSTITRWQVDNDVIPFFRFSMYEKKTINGDNTMELKLERENKPGYTIGHLKVDGRPFCDVLERTDRGLRSSMSTREILDRKDPGDTAIPAGKYRVTLTVRSPKFSSRPEYSWCSGFLPRLTNVPVFSGVLIHAGNTKKASIQGVSVGWDHAAHGPVDLIHGYAETALCEDAERDRRNMDHDWP